MVVEKIYQKEDILKFVVCLGVDGGDDGGVAVG